MGEDKGTSFTQMKKNQYLDADDKELENEQFYKLVENDNSEHLKEMNDDIVKDMWLKDELSELVAKYLNSGDKKLPKFYHLLKTHKTPGGDYFCAMCSTRKTWRLCRPFFATRD